jgi:CRISPR/Cas system CMR subunit Cmr4 (Cas7 group RAMP superfamily)
LFCSPLLFPNGKEEVKREGEKEKEEKKKGKNSFPLDKPVAVPVPAFNGVSLVVMCN